MRLLTLLLVLFLCTCVRAQEISRVEPPDWWVGFEQTELQLLVYGKDIGHLRAEINHPGVTLLRTVCPPNANYLFLYLNVAADASPGTFPIVFRDQDREVLRHSYTLQARRDGAAGVQGFNNSDVLYLITPDRFANGDPENDAVASLIEMPKRNFPGGRHGGDIAGMQQRLDYLTDLGITAIWINPVLENDMDQYSYHGYSTTDFYRVDPRFGSNAAYRDFCAAAGAKDVKVIMDMILNHSGSNHWFVVDPPSEDWVNYGGKYVNTNHRRTTVQDVHASEFDRRAFSDGWFVRTMPDLNQRNRLLADYLIQNSIWWIEYAGLAGIRMDTYPYPDKDFMAEWTCAVLREYPNFSIVGEEWSTQPAIVSYWQAGKDNHDGYTSCLPSLMDFPLQDALKLALTEKETWSTGWIKLYETLALDFLYADHDALVVFPDNHDMDRIYTQLGEDPALFRLAMAYTLTTRGTPQLYYGTEILMENSAAPGDHGIIRTDFPGGWAGDKVNGFTGAGLSAEQRAAKDYLRSLLRWRKSAKVIHDGKLMQFAPNNGSYVYFRYTDDEKVMVVLNKGTEGLSLDLSIYEEILPAGATLRDVLTGKEYSTESKTLPLQVNTAYILRVE
ncbi:glycoside hydrolase family 13 protein [Neolewinella lacunae]|uniref:Glycoside hydrolase family 13 protein n=1 Tax=Neolewinella lacunae TaxID=1517758 RepID=A0A923PMA4_9BACT|nr:glycoside hydrolase family 13 protein [Neolewinella lacunae]MBC6996059.1 glycoside hydrolase family 13 protein [Neolewinella lacunae]MDN3636821.1 glycoside hydrolase family 13 protein [Neolewinella lacunae]